MMNTDIALLVERLHKWADEQNDVRDHDEYHAAGAVLADFNGAILTDREQDYVVRWIAGLCEAMLT